MVKIRLSGHENEILLRQRGAQAKNLFLAQAENGIFATSQDILLQKRFGLDFGHDDHGLSFQSRHGGAGGNVRTVAKDGWDG